MLGLAPVSGAPVSGLKEEPSPVTTQALTLGNLVYVVEIETSGGTYRYADRQYTTAPTDSPANTYYGPRAEEPVNLRRTVSLAPESMSDGSQQASVTLLNADGALDTVVTDEAVDGREVRIRVGEVTDPLSEFSTVFTGQGVSWSTSGAGNKVTIKLRDSAYRLERPVNPVYGSTYDTVTVDSGVVGRSQPLAYGIVRHVEPVLIDQTNHIYHVHAGSVEEILEVRDQGATLTDEGDVADLTSGSTSAGAYRTDQAAGLIQLGERPTGTVTITLKGGNDGGYVSAIPTIARRILTDYGLESRYRDDGSFDSLASLVDGPGGIYIRDAMTARDILDKLLKGIGAYWYARRDGRVAVARLREPDTTESVLSLDELNILKLRRMTLPGALNPPHWRRRVGYRKTWTDLTGDFASSVPDSEVQELTETWRVTADSDSSVQTTHALAQDPPLLGSHLDEKADADALATRLLNLHKAERSMYEVQLDSRGVQVEMGNNVRITYGRFGLSGQAFRAWPVREDPRRRQITFALWG